MLTLILVLFLLAAPARAEEDSPEAHDEEASRYYERKMWDAARKEWQTAYGLDPRPRYLFNIGQTYRKENLHAEAVDNFLRYFSESERPEFKDKDRLDPTVRIDLEAYMAQVRAELERVQNARAAKGQGPEPAPYLVADEIVEAEELFDQMVREFKAGNTAVAQDLVKRLEEVYRLRADPLLLLYFAQAYEKVNKKKEALEYYRRYLASDPADLAARRQANERFTKLTPPPPGQKYLYPGLVFGILGLAGVGVGVAEFVEAQKNFNEFQGPITEAEKRDRRDRGDQLGLISLIGYAAGGALLGTSAIFIGVALKKGVRQKPTLNPLGAPADGVRGALLFPKSAPAGWLAGASGPLPPLSSGSDAAPTPLRLNLTPLPGGGGLVLGGAF